MTIQSTISDSAYYDSEGNSAVSNPKSDSLIATQTSDGNERKITDTDTTNGNPPHKLILNWIIPKIIPGAIRLIYQTIMEYMAGIRETLDARQIVILNKIVTDTARSGERILQTSREIIRTGRYSTMPRDGNTVVAAARSTSPVQIWHSITDSPIRNRNQEIINPIGPVSPQWISNSKKLKTSINGFFAQERGFKPICSKLVGCKFSDNSSVNVNLRCEMNFVSNAVFTQNPNFINIRLVSVNTIYKLGSVSVPTTRVVRPTSSSDCIRHGHYIEETTADIVSKTIANSNYILKSGFETMREIQDFEQENISMTNRTTSSIDDGEMVKVRTKTPEPTPLTRPT